MQASQKPYFIPLKPLHSGSRSEKFVFFHHSGPSFEIWQIVAKLGQNSGFWLTVLKWRQITYSEPLCIGMTRLGISVGKPLEKNFNLCRILEQLIFVYSKHSKTKVIICSITGPGSIPGGLWRQPRIGPEEPTTSLYPQQNYPKYSLYHSPCQSGYHEFTLGLT